MDHDALADLLAELAVRYRVPGAQLAVHRVGHTTAVAHGELAAGTGARVREDSAFPLGSLTKPFTATVAMTLAAAGDADLDVPLARYCPELRGTVGDRVTLRQLLSHRGGLASGIDESDVRPAGRRRWVMAHCREADLVHPPGTLFSYSNIGFIVVGLLVELITGMDWREAVTGMLLRPSGITPAFASVAGTAGRTSAAGHAVSPETGRVQVLPIQSLAELEAPAGALAASAADLVALAAAALADPGLSKEMLSDQLAEVTVGSFGLADSWGLGWGIYRAGGVAWYGHDGNADGTSCHLRFEPETGTAVALTTNASTGMALWPELITRLRQCGLDVGTYSFWSLPGEPAAQPAPEGCAGSYRNGFSEFVVTPRDDGRLELSADGLLQAVLTCYPGLRFTMENAGHHGMRYIGRFVRDPATGEPYLLQIGGRTARRTPADRP
jgi:CubicO group peptidase (beta-lactamase class C family)